MYNKKPLREAIKNLDRAAAPAKKKDMIVDPMGQWKYPGQNTRIPSNDITMQGVPYPVWAVPNVGTPQMMYPEQDYYFPGANHVDEYPQVAQRGGDISIPQLNQYEDGGEYDLTDEEIAELKAGGYIVEDVDTNEYEKGGFQDDLGKHRKLLRDWTYGASIGMLHKAQTGLTTVPTQEEAMLQQASTKGIPYADKAITLPEVTVSPRQYVPQATQQGNLLDQAFQNEMLKKADWERRSSGAAQPVDELWTLPIAIPAATSAAAIPVMGTTVGELANLGFLAHGVSQLPTTAKSWYDYSKGDATLRDALFQTGTNALEFLGAKSGVKTAGELPTLFNQALKNNAGRFSTLKQGTLPVNMSPEDFALLNEIEEGMAINAYNSPNKESLIQNFAKKTTLNDSQLTRMFGRSKKEILKNASENRGSTEILPINTSGPRITNAEDLNIPAYRRRGITNFDDQFAEMMQQGQAESAGLNNEFTIPSQATLLDDAGNWSTFADNAKTKKGMFTEFRQMPTNFKNLFRPKVYEVDKTAVPTISAYAYQNRRQMLTDLLSKINQGMTEANIDDIITGSLNTSYNSYLPQMDYIFKNASTQGLSEPLFLGYQPLNKIGFLSQARLPEEMQFEYLKHHLNKIQNRSGKQLNLGTLPPYMTKDKTIWLPQYGLRKLSNEYTGLKKEDGGYIETQLTQKEIDEYRKGGYVIDELD